MGEQQPLMRVGAATVACLGRRGGAWGSRSARLCGASDGYSRQARRRLPLHCKPALDPPTQLTGSSMGLGDQTTGAGGGTGAAGEAPGIGGGTLPLVGVPHTQPGARAGQAAGPGPPAASGAAGRLVKEEGRGRAPPWGQASPGPASREPRRLLAKLPFTLASSMLHTLKVSGRSPAEPAEGVPGGSGPREAPAEAVFQLESAAAEGPTMGRQAGMQAGAGGGTAGRLQAPKARGPAALAIICGWGWGWGCGVGLGLVEEPWLARPAGRTCHGSCH